MSYIKNDLSNLQELFPQTFTEGQKSACKTLFYKKLALLMHEKYGGKMQTIPKVPLEGFNWFNAWYTPGVSAVSTSIRDNNDTSYHLSNRSNLVAVVSDSTRVLGDGDCTPSGGLGVMEGKAMLMKYLGGVDSIALCINSKDETGEPSADRIIDFVKMVQPSFGAINLEDISQPNCFKVLDVLREECDIPVWHDDAQGTACVTLAGIINALKLVGKKMSDCKVVLYGAGASNTSIARLMIADGADPKKIIMFDSRSSLHKNNERYKNDPRFYRQWELCQTTNSDGITDIEEAFNQADVLVALSKPGPDTVKKEWIAKMADKAIVFVCSNPIPEIYPYAAKEAGAYIVATGRGDFPNQVNNSVCFPSILKGALLVHARKISDGMAITAAHAIAKFAENRGITTEDIIPKMTESDLFPMVAAEVAMKAIEEGLARITLSREEALALAKQDIDKTHAMMQHLMDNNFIQRADLDLVQKALDEAVAEVGKM